jgi:5-methylcytosine-specific restriction enzyme subunit McrC
MYPDLTLQHDVSGHLIILDTKFTAKSLVAGWWGNLTFNRNHLFQIYAYLQSQEHCSQHHESSTGILLYPTVGHALSTAVSIQGHEIRWETIYLAQQWEEIEKNLLAIPLNSLTEIRRRQ